MLLHLIGITVPLLPFGEVLENFIVLLKQLHALSIQLFGLAFDDGKDLLHLQVVKTAHVLNL